MRVRKRRLSATCFTVLLFAPLLWDVPCLPSMAKEEGAGPRPYYKSVRIQEGDSLWGIARQYREGSSMSMDEYVNQLRQMNSLKKDTIHTGQYLTVVYFE